MASPLTPQVATSLVRENNGGTPQEIIRDGLNRGIIKGTVAGQVGALAKLYKDDKLPEVKRDKQKRPHRYYLKGSVVAQQPSPSISGPITFRPTSEQEEILAAFTETRTFSNNSEVVQWLLSEGVASKRGYIDEVMQIYREIERLRRRVKQIGS